MPKLFWDMNRIWWGFPPQHPAFQTVRAGRADQNRQTSDSNRLWRRAYILYGCNPFMMGLPGETEESIQKTSDYAMSLDLDDMSMSKFTPFHGAPIWSRIHKFGHSKRTGAK